MNCLKQDPLQIKAFPLNKIKGKHWEMHEIFSSQEQ